jgi:hypothetical protein
MGACLIGKPWPGERRSDCGQGEMYAVDPRRLAIQSTSDQQNTKLNRLPVTHDGEIELAASPSCTGDSGRK